MDDETVGPIDLTPAERLKVEPARAKMTEEFIGLRKFMSVTLLNVDHNDAGRYAKSRLLRLAGYQVIEARTGAEALRMTQELRPPLVLLDVLLPDMDGRRFAGKSKRIRRPPISWSCTSRLRA